MELKKDLNYIHAYFIFCCCSLHFSEAALLLVTAMIVSRSGQQANFKKNITAYYEGEKRVTGYSREIVFFFINIYVTLIICNVLHPLPSIG